jgi:hypothetical protein
MGRGEIEPMFTQWLARLLPGYVYSGRLQLLIFFIWTFPRIGDLFEQVNTDSRPNTGNIQVIFSYSCDKRAISWRFISTSCVQLYFCLLNAMVKNTSSCYSITEGQILHPVCRLSTQSDRVVLRAIQTASKLRNTYSLSLIEVHD